MGTSRQIKVGILTAPHIEFEQRAQTFILKDVRIGIGFHWDRYEDQEFAGTLEIRNNADGTQTAINTIDLEDYLQHNLYKPSKRPANRERYWNCLETMGFSALAKRYGINNLRWQRTFFSLYEAKSDTSRQLFHRVKVALPGNWQVDHFDSLQRTTRRKQKYCLS